MQPWCHNIVVAFMALSVILNCADAQNVPCALQQSVCECNANSERCVFQLEIEELQTFTSYFMREFQVQSRGITGIGYHLEDDGMYNSTAPVEGNPNCYTNERVDELWFSNNGCSVPLTVDGRTYRMGIAVNGLIPGPTLIVREGQLVAINVINRLTSEGITIHWHGIHQRGTPWMDGVGFISQPPIVPGATFTYIFNANPAGTHWYHSHTGAQRTDGLFGSLIVRENAANLNNVQAALNINMAGLGNFIDQPESHTLSLLDWQRESSLSLFTVLHAALARLPETDSVPAIDEVPIFPLSRDMIARERYRPTTSTDGIDVGPVPYWSGLINGRGRYRDPMNVAVASRLSIFNVDTDEAYRFRLVGAQSLYAYRFSIDSHKLTVIATDGVFIEPVVVDYIIIHSGERYDFILRATQPASNYWIIAETLEDDIQSRAPHIAEAVLHYEDAADPQHGMYTNVDSSPRSCTANDQCTAINCPFAYYPQRLNINCIHIHQLRSLLPLPIEQLPRIQPNCASPEECERFFNFGFEGDSTTSAINGLNFKLPVNAYQANPDSYERDQNKPNTNICPANCNLDDNRDEPEPVCTCTHVRTIASGSADAGRTVHMILSAVGDIGRGFRNFSHPVHLHGHSFHVVEIGHGTTESDTGLLMGNNPNINCGDNVLCPDPRWRDDDGPDLTAYENTENPGLLKDNIVRKDTVIVPAGGYVIIAFQADNPGYWFMHCHIESHQLEGMGVLIRELPSEHPPPPPGINNCGDFLWTFEEFLAWPPEPTPTPSPSPSWKTIPQSWFQVLLALFVLFWFWF